MNYRGPARAGPRPPAAWVSPVPPLGGRWGWGLFSGGNIHRAATSPLLGPDLPNHHSYYPHGCFFLSVLWGRVRGLPSGVCQSFSECIHFSRRPCSPQMLKSPFGAPCGVPETAPHQESGELLLGCFPACACLTKQGWVSAIHPLSLPPGGWPGDPGRPSPLKPLRNITSSVSTTALSPCTSGSGQPQTLRRTPGLMTVGNCGGLLPDSSSIQGELLE